MRTRMALIKIEYAAKGLYPQDYPKLAGNPGD